MAFTAAEGRVRILTPHFVGNLYDESQFRELFFFAQPEINLPESIVKCPISC
jgi:hypothetical protein